MSPPIQDRYVSRRILRERFDLSEYTLTRFLRANTIRRISTPGGDARWHLGDVETALGIEH